MDRTDFGIMVLKEMSLNYKNQFPDEIPNMDFVINLVGTLMVEEKFITEWKRKKIN